MVLCDVAQTAADRANALAAEGAAQVAALTEKYGIIGNAYAVDVSAATGGGEADSTSGGGGASAAARPEKKQPLVRLLAHTTSARLGLFFAHPSSPFPRPSWCGVSQGNAGKACRITMAQLKDKSMEELQEMLKTADDRGRKLIKTVMAKQGGATLYNAASTAAALEEVRWWLGSE